MPAARPIWKGHIRLSLVSIPVELFTATVAGTARVEDTACVSGSAVVSGSAEVSGTATVFGDARVVLIGGSVICLVGVIDDLFELDALSKLAGDPACR